MEQAQCVTLSHLSVNDCLPSFLKIGIFIFGFPLCPIRGLHSVDVTLGLGSAHFEPTKWKSWEWSRVE